MARNPATAPAPTPTHPWSIDLDGVNVPLVPSLPALLGIEAVTRKTIYAHLAAASARALTIADLAMILRFLAGPDAPLEGLDPPRTLLKEYIDATDGGPTPAQEIVMRNGIMEVLAATMGPILAATKGKVDEFGHLIPGKE